MILLRGCKMDGLEKFQLRRWLSLRLRSYDMNLLWEGTPSPLVTFLQDHVIESALLRYLPSELRRLLGYFTNSIPLSLSPLHPHVTC
jgi:hypothetical protein